MKLLEVAIGTVLRIPEAWMAFTYKGVLYRRVEKVGVSRFAVDQVWAKVADENKSVLREKRA